MDFCLVHLGFGSTLSLSVVTFAYLSCQQQHRVLRDFSFFVNSALVCLSLSLLSAEDTPSLLWVTTPVTPANPLTVTTLYIYMECIYIQTTEEKDQTFLTPLPPALSVFQPDSWFSIDAAGRRGVLVAAQPGRQEAAGPQRPGGGLREADHAR